MARASSQRNSTAEANSGTMVGTVVLQGNTSMGPQALEHAKSQQKPKKGQQSLTDPDVQQITEFLVAPFNSKELLWRA